MGLSRRQMLQASATGFGYAAFATLANEVAIAENRTARQAGAFDNSKPSGLKTPHFPAKAKRVIFMSMRGGPSHVDSFDYKPELAKHEGEKAKGNRKLMKSPWGFQKHGESGLPISDLFPHLAKHADRLCLINGMYGKTPAHPQAYLQMHTGEFRFVRPSMGAWTLYGLGTENQNLPGFITIKPEQQLGGAQNYGSSFLPATFQGTPIGQRGQSLAKAKVGNLTNAEYDLSTQRDQLDLIQSMNKDLLEQKKVDPQIEGVIESYELAFRMQSELPSLMEFESESKETLESYGIGEKDTTDFGQQCLLARRFAEAGVRFIEVTHGNWDQHNGLSKNHAKNCTSIDKPIAALISDLNARDLLKDTLIVWGGEFGRTPHVKQKDGRDHNATGFSMWMCGGGVKGGMRHGSTDEFGIEAISDRTNFHDLHATMLHLLGMDHTKLTYRYAGRDFRLTDVHGNVMKKIIA